MLGVVVALALQSRRDLAASLWAARPGRAEARPSPGTPLGLATRLQRGALIGWAPSRVAIVGWAPRRLAIAG